MERAKPKLYAGKKPGFEGNKYTRVITDKKGNITEKGTYFGFTPMHAATKLAKKQKIELNEEFQMRRIGSKVNTFWTVTRLEFKEVKPASDGYIPPWLVDKKLRDVDVTEDRSKAFDGKEIAAEEKYRKEQEEKKAKAEVKKIKETEEVEEEKAEEVSEEDVESTDGE